MIPFPSVGNCVTDKAHSGSDNGSSGISQGAGGPMLILQVCKIFCKFAVRYEIRF